MKHLMVFLLVMTACFALAAEPARTDPGNIVIAHSADNCDPDHADMLLLNMYANKVIVQDLHTRTLIITDGNKSGTPVFIAFPEELLSLYPTDNGAIFALTLNGVVKLAGLAEAIEKIQNKTLKNMPATVLQKASLKERQGDFRLFIDKSGKYALWDRSESLLQIFDVAGSLIDAFPCPTKPVLTGKDSFISAFFVAESGTRLIEIDFTRPVQDGAQLETTALNIELANSNEVQIVDYDAATGIFTAMMLPASPEIPTNEALPEESPAKQPTDAAVSQKSVESEATIADNESIQEFIDPANHGQMQMILCRIDQAGSIKQILRLPCSYSDGRIAMQGDSVYHLMPQYESKDDTIRLTGLNIETRKISE